MMKFEDRHTIGTTGLSAFDFEHFVESAVTKQEEYNVFKYDDTILRPRHLVMLYDVCKRIDPDLTFSAHAPVVQYNGHQYAMTSRATETFEDLLKCIEDVITSGERYALYSVSRHVAVDPGDFNVKARFKLRLGKLG